MRARLWAVAVTVLAAGCVAGEQAPVQTGPPIPYDDAGACPFEGCVYREWVANAPVQIHTGRTLSSPVAFTVARGERVTALTGVVTTTRPGRVQFDMAYDVEASGGRIHVEPGQTLYLLTSQGEGFMKGWFNGRLYEGIDTATFSSGGGCAGGPRPCVGRLVEPWQFEWWVQIRNASGDIGWTREPDKFDNKDALG